MKEKSMHKQNEFLIDEELQNKQRKCSKCHGIFPATPEFFHRNCTVKGGLDGWCKGCKKEYHKNIRKNRYLLKRFNITIEEFEEMLEVQDYSCVICNKQLNGGKETQIDHCHKTGKIRGVLCYNCNLALGHFSDNPYIFVKAIKYLKENR